MVFVPVPPFAYAVGERVFLTANLLKDNPHAKVEQSTQEFPERLPIGTCGEVVAVEEERVLIKLWIGSAESQGDLDEAKVAFVRLSKALCGGMLQRERRFADRERKSALDRASVKAVLREREAKKARSWFRLGAMPSKS